MLVPAVAFLMALSVSFVMLWVKESACNGFTHSLTHIVVRMSRIINGLWRPSYPLSSAVFFVFADSANPGGRRVGRGDRIHN